MPNVEPVLIAGRYRLVTALATGGMGVVWKGWDERLHRDVAVKQLRVQHGLSPAEATTARNRAMREARNTARLHHPHAVPVYDVVEQDGEPCLIMEFLPSISLQEAIANRGTMPPAEVARIGSEIAQALSAAHRAGIVHRDVKPGNVLLAEDGTAKLTDFGISHALGDVALTQTGMLTGTPAYLAPEVARGQPAGFASDVFSLGSTLYTATEGTPPFGQDSNAMAVLHRVASGHLRPPQRSGPLTALLVQMMTTDPDARPTMPEVSRRLAALHASAAQSAADTAAWLPTAQLEVPQPSPLAALLDAPTTRPDGRPARGPVRPGPRRQRGLIAALLVGAAVIAAIVVAIALANKKDPAQSAVGRSSPQVSAPETTAASKSGSKPPARQSSSVSQTTPGVQTSAAGTAGQLAQVITDYYALVPDNLPAGWARLTPAYQQNKSHGYAAYQQFWSQFESVDVSDVSGQAPNVAQATITYVYKDGRRSTERTRFALVRSGGQWKIDGSTVV